MNMSTDVPSGISICHFSSCLYLFWNLLKWLLIIEISILLLTISFWLCFKINHLLKIIYLSKWTQFYFQYHRISSIPQKSNRLIFNLPKLPLFEVSIDLKSWLWVRTSVLSVFVVSRRIFVNLEHLISHPRLSVYPSSCSDIFLNLSRT